MSSLRPLVTRNEIRWACAWAAFLMALTCVPYFLGVVRTPYGAHYMGYVYNPDEPNVHQAWIRQALEGRLFFENRFTSEPHEGRFFNVFLLSVGWFARLTHLDVYWAFQFARIFWGFALLVGVYVCLATFTYRRHLRRLTFILVATSSGLGWLYVWYTHGFGALDPIDTAPGLAMPEAITFLTLYLNPLFAFSMLLLLVSVTLAVQALRQEDFRYAMAAGVGALVLANSHTYDILPLWLTLGLYVLLRGVQRRQNPLGAALPSDSPASGGGGGRDYKRSRAPLRFPPQRGAWGVRLRAMDWKLFGIILLISGPAVLYQAHLILSDPLYGAKANTWTASWPMLPYREYRSLGPWFRDLGWSLFNYFLSYGLLIPLAWGGLYLTIRRRRERYYPFILWLCATFPLLYAPVAFQRKMAEGMHIPLCVLAAWALDAGVRRLAALCAWLLTRRQRRLHRVKWFPRAARSFLFLGMIALMPSNLHFIRSNIADLFDNNQSKLRVLMPPHYLAEAQYQGLEWLRTHAGRDSVVLCTPLIGSYIPPRSGCKVYVGHWAETIHYGGPGGKVARAWDFFQDRAEPKEKYDFLQQNRIRFVFLGPYEHQLNQGHVEQLPGLREVFHAVNDTDNTGDVWIFEVVSTEDQDPQG